MNRLSDKEYRILGEVYDDLKKRAYSPAEANVNQHARISYMVNSVSQLLNIDPRSQYDLNTQKEGIRSFFEFLLKELHGRLERPVKMCGIFGKAKPCPSKKEGELRACMEEIWEPLYAATKSYRRAGYDSDVVYEIQDLFGDFGRPSSPATGVNPFDEFMENALDAFEAVDNVQCRKFERIDNFIANVGKYTKGYLLVFRMLAASYREQTQGFQKSNSANTATSWNSQSMGSFGGSRRGLRGKKTRRNRRKSKKTLRRR